MATQRNEPSRRRQRADFRVHRRSWQKKRFSSFLRKHFAHLLDFQRLLPLVYCSAIMVSFLTSCTFVLSFTVLPALPTLPFQDLPTSAGWLAHWQLLVATTAVFNFVQNFVTLKFTRRIYNNVPPNTGGYYLLYLFS